MKVVISDLDGTLLYAGGSGCDRARMALRALQQERIPLVLCTSKTRAEMEYWRERLGLDAPFVVENGGAVYVPRGYFGGAVPGSFERDGYDVVEFGAPYADLVEALAAAAAEGGCAVLGFSDMTIGEVSRRTGLSVVEAGLAKQREYSEPFEIMGRHREHLLRSIEQRGRRCTTGGLFCHITGDNDKASAVRVLSELYRRAYGQITIIGLGDSWNDLPFLKFADVPVVIRSGASGRLRQVLPGSTITWSENASGWNEAVLEAIGRRGTTLGCAARG